MEHKCKKPPGAGGYSAGCRCDGCVEGMRAGQRRRYAKNKQNPEWVKAKNAKGLARHHERYKSEPEYRSRVLAHCYAKYDEKYQYIIKLKLSSGCADCGHNAHSEAIDFDHVRGKKETASMQFLCGGSWKRLLAEIAKCEIVCSNCHRVRTRARRLAKKSAA